MAFPSVTYTFTNSTTADATQVNQNFTDMINGLSDGTKNLNMSAATFASTLTANGAVILGASSSNNLTINASLNSSILLTTNVAFDIGGTSFGLRALYFGNGSTNTLKILSGTLTGSWTWTLPVSAPAANNSYMSFTSGGVASFAAVKVPTIQTFTSGTGTYTTPTTGGPAGAGPLYIKVRMAGGGGGGGCTNSLSVVGTDGGISTFGTSLLTANGGAHGTLATNAGGAGGAASVTTSSTVLQIIAVTGGGGSGGYADSAAINTPGALGGVNPLGGSAISVTAGSGGAGKTNTGAGGAAAGAQNTLNTGGGGGAGGYLEAIITGVSLASTFSYAVGAGGSGESGNVANGGNGGSGIIIVEEYYQ